MVEEIKKTKSKLDEIIETLHIDVTEENIPTILKFISLFTLVGGLSIIGNSFVDIGQPNGSVNAQLYILRLVIGIISIMISYGLVKKERWAVWLYAVIFIVGLYTNPITVLVPGIVLLYLYIIRKQLKICIADVISEKIINAIYGLFKKLIYRV